jgi:hypothetical protein
MVLRDERQMNGARKIAPTSLFDGPGSQGHVVCRSQTARGISSAAGIIGCCCDHRDFDGVEQMLLAEPKRRRKTVSAARAPKPRRLAIRDQRRDVLVSDTQRDCEGAPGKDSGHARCDTLIVRPRRD